MPAHKIFSFAVFLGFLVPTCQTPVCAMYIGGMKPLIGLPSRTVRPPFSAADEKTRQRLLIIRLKNLKEYAKHVAPTLHDFHVALFNSPHLQKMLEEAYPQKHGLVIRFLIDVLTDNFMLEKTLFDYKIQKIKRSQPNASLNLRGLLHKNLDNYFWLYHATQQLLASQFMLTEQHKHYHAATKMIDEFANAISERFREGLHRLSAPDMQPYYDANAAEDLEDYKNFVRKFGMSTYEN